MTTWHVTTPTYSVHEVVLDDGTGPTYDVSDYEMVEANTRREAISIAVKMWLKEGNTKYWLTTNYCSQRKSDGLSPWTGIKAQSDDELKNEVHAQGPPDWTPDTCDTCDESHYVIRSESNFTWIWLDNGIDEDLTWGWFGTCGGEIGEKIINRSSHSNGASIGS
jgi:hypothetical protein